VPLALDPAEALALARAVKIELRDRMRRVRRALGDDARAARSAKIAAHVQSLDAWASAANVALFVPMRTEIDVTLLERAARGAGKRIAAPRMIEEGRTLELRAWDADVEPVESGRMVREPPESALLVDPASIDLVVVPGLAFDERGARIGYGAGLYDRLLPKCAKATRVGVCLDFQLIAEVPETEGDERVGFVVTDERIVVVPR
jgi:5-formyltetrahydrofolate cyclo-ligase